MEMQILILGWYWVTFTLWDHPSPGGDNSLAWCLVKKILHILNVFSQIICSMFLSAFVIR